LFPGTLRPAIGRPSLLLTDLSLQLRPRSFNPVRGGPFILRATLRVELITASDNCASSGCWRNGGAITPSTDCWSNGGFATVTDKSVESTHAKMVRRTARVMRTAEVASLGAAIRFAVILVLVSVSARAKRLFHLQRLSTQAPANTRRCFRRSRWGDAARNGTGTSRGGKDRLASQDKQRRNVRLRGTPFGTIQAPRSIWRKYFLRSKSTVRSRRMQY